MSTIVPYETFKKHQDAREYSKTINAVSEAKEYLMGEIVELEEDVIHSLEPLGYKCGICLGSGQINWQGVPRICPTCDGSGY